MVKNGIVITIKNLLKKKRKKMKAGWIDLYLADDWAEYKMKNEQR